MIFASMKNVYSSYLNFLCHNREYKPSLLKLITFAFSIKIRMDHQQNQIKEKKPGSTVVKKSVCIPVLWASNIKFLNINMFKISRVFHNLRYSMTWYLLYLPQLMQHSVLKSSCNDLAHHSKGAKRQPVFFHPEMCSYTALYCINNFYKDARMYTGLSLTKNQRKTLFWEGKAQR